MSLKVFAPYCPWPPSDSGTPEADKQVLPNYHPLPEGGSIQNLNSLQLQQQIKLSRLLNEINNSVRSTLDLEEILNSACRLLGQAIHCSRVSILIKESEDAETLTTRGEYNLGEYPMQMDLTVPIADNPHLQILMTQPGPLAVPRFQDFPGLGDRSRELAKALSIRSMLAIATRWGGQVNGIIKLQQCDEEREWTEWEWQLLEGVAGQLAIAIHQAQLYAASGRLAKRESLLRLVTNQIRSTLDPDTILQTAVRGVRQWLDTDRVVIYKFKENWHGEIVVEDLSVPWPSIFGDMVADNCFSGHYGEMYQQGRVRDIADIHNAGLDPCHEKFLAALQVKANLIVPILIGQKLWGLLIAHECRTIRKWQPAEIELLRQLGDQMAIAISQAELYAQVQDAAAISQAQAEQMSATLEELRSTQMQLIQSEKMSSLGQLVAGIAHEINNANNFIHANLPHAREYAETLSDAIARCAEVSPQAADAIAVLNDELELDYIRSDFPNLLKSMEEGSDRIREIVLTLRNFSRLDESESKSVDLNQGIESSLAMLQHRLKAGIKIYKEYGNLPLVSCRASQMNQVFFNLLNNALDAVEIPGNSGEITIRTLAITPELVSISIRDNGVGIPLEIQGRIFDPFFTTKKIGEGTGLGLSICYQAIVKGHGGQIRCISQPGEGAEFIVELPVKSVAAD